MREQTTKYGMSGREIHNTWDQVRSFEMEVDGGDGDGGDGDGDVVVVAMW